MLPSEIIVRASILYMRCIFVNHILDLCCSEIFIAEEVLDAMMAYNYGITRLQRRICAWCLIMLIGANFSRSDLSIASFNVQVFGKSKMQKPDVVQVLQKVPPYHLQVQSFFMLHLLLP